MGPDKFREECGVFGVVNHPEAAHMAYLGLYALQHRGQEGAGIVSCNGSRFCMEKGMGLVADLFTEEKLRRLPGTMAIGHNRYSTTGESHVKNVQPLLISYALGHLALAHNGNLVNAQLLRSELEAYGAIFQSTTDSEVIIHLIAHSRESVLLDRITSALHKVRGAYSLVILSEEGMYGIRDPYGFRPLSLGRFNDAWVLASESVAFDLIQAEFIRDVEPGEIVFIDTQGRLTSYHPFAKVPRASCIFEHIYFARPDSKIYGYNVYTIRRQLGRQLALEAPVQADVVIPVPDSGVAIALGYSEGTGLPFEEGLVRSHYIGRTFIEPQQSIRDFGVKLKLNTVRDVLAGKRVVVVDDSIVRGTTSRKIIRMIWQAGAKEVHVRIGSPQIISPCFYGINTPTRQELIAATHTLDEVREYVTATTLHYLSVEGMLKVFKNDTEGFCTACFTENYPITFTREEIIQLGLF
jgi:amidophosphoribosyltransferase